MGRLARQEDRRTDKELGLWLEPEEDATCNLTSLP